MSSILLEIHHSLVCLQKSRRFHKLVLHLQRPHFKTVDVQQTYEFMNRREPKLYTIEDLKKLCCRRLQFASILI